MPTYELALILKTLPRNQLAETLKRTAGYIFKEGGIIRKINNLGHSPTPFRISSHGNVQKDAHFFVLDFDCPSFSVKPLIQACNLDSDIVRTRIYEPVQPVQPSECTIEIENQPAPFRPEVQSMLRLAERKKKILEKKVIKLNTGLNFDPFPS